MSVSSIPSIGEIVQADPEGLLKEWVKRQLQAETSRPDLVSESECRKQSSEFLDLFRQGTEQGGFEDIGGPEWADMRSALEELSRKRASQGFTASETATFIFSLKEPLFARLQAAMQDNPVAASQAQWQLNVLLDKLGLLFLELLQKEREQLILQQREEIMELSTPVVQIWEGILGVPIIGTLDSSRTQLVMEGLLERLAQTGARVAIIDITGVPAVDTLVAQHLLKTTTAAKLMGAECVISGIRPEIAQTLVTLGVSLQVTTKATWNDALEVAFQRLGLQVTKKSQS